MALIGEIRKRSWLMIICIGIGMGGFILMDMMGNAGRGSAVTGGDIGEVEGKTISYAEFARMEQTRNRNRNSDNSFQDKENTWQSLIAETLLQNESDDLGINVSPSELKELLYGSMVSPVIYQSPEFYNPQTGRIDVSQVQQAHDNFVAKKLAPEWMYFFADLENRIITDQIGTKLSSMVGKAMYTPSWMAEEVNKLDNQTANISYVKVPYEQIEDSEVPVDDKELQAYMNEHKVEFTQDQETREVEFVEFEVFPSGEDSAAIKKKIADLAADFRTVENDSDFIVENYGIYDTKYVKKEDLSSVIADSLYKVSVGTVVGPYIDQGYYKAVKLVDRRGVRDSVEARHIFRSVENAEFNPDGVKAAMQFLVDSVKTVLETTDSTFAAMASKYGQDGTRANGGDLGGMLGPDIGLPSLRNLIFYEAKVGKLYTLVSPSGVHLVEVTKVVDKGTTGVRVAYVEEPIIPSQATQDKGDKMAFNFVRDNRSQETFNKSVSGQGLNKRSAVVGANDFVLPGSGGLPAGQSSRDLIRWAFKANKGDVSPEFYTFLDPVHQYKSKFVVAVLNDVNKAGMMPLKQVRNEVAVQVRNKKKAEKLIAQLNGKDLTAAGSQFCYDIPHGSKSWWC